MRTGIRIQEPQCVDRSAGHLHPLRYGVGRILQSVGPRVEAIHLAVVRQTGGEVDRQTGNVL